MPLSAHSPWFTLNLNGRSDFGVYAFSGREAISEPYEFTLDLTHRNAVQDVNTFIGAPALLTVYDRSGTPRLVHGLVRQMSRGEHGNRFAHYQCVIVPRVWFLDQNRDHRVFQHQSVPDIITRILQEQGFAAETFAFKCFHQYPPREYCVQYGESDLYFLSRLCEEEGMYYYFEHSENGHCLCFSDMPGGPDIPGGPTVLYRPGSGQSFPTAVIHSLDYHVEARADATTCRDWNFEMPGADLTAHADEPDFRKAPLPPGLDLDRYQYPHLYQRIDPGRRYADIQLQRQLTFSRWIDGGGDVARYMPGFTFIVEEHRRDDVNGRWWVTLVNHHGEQPQVLEHEAPDRGMRYQASFQAIPALTRYVPPEAHPKIRIPNKQTAIVTGPKGEEIYPDRYGRVKVQFFWDREGQWNENSSCWVRPAQGWAGTGYGLLAIPRIGQEVIVSFLEGDPDRPLITGRVYHAGNKPPYDLPVHKTRAVFKSMSTPGGDGPRGFNELRVEDKAGQEEIYGHAEKEVNVYVKNDWKEHVLHDRHRTVDGNTYLTTRGETHEIFLGPRKTELAANDNLTVHADSHTGISGSWLAEAGAEIHLEAGVKLVMEAGAELILKAGGGWARIDASGISGGPAVDLNSGGSPARGTPAAPLTPDPSQGPGVPPPPQALEPANMPPPLKPDCFRLVTVRRGLMCRTED